MNDTIGGQNICRDIIDGFIVVDQQRIGKRRVKELKRDVVQSKDVNTKYQSALVVESNQNVIVHYKAQNLASGGLKQTREPAIVGEKGLPRVLGWCQHGD